MIPAIFRRLFPRATFLAAIGILTWYFHRTGLLEKTIQWIASFGVWGPAIFVAIYILTCIFFVPSMVFTFSGGVLFGFWKGVFLSLIGIGAGSIAAFLIGRYLARDLITRRFGKNKIFSKLARSTHKKGWKVVTLARLTPIFPFTVFNYMFGITHIPARHYLGASLLGTVPSTVLYTYLGTLLGSFAAFGEPGRARTWQEWTFLAFSLVATILLSYYLARFAQKSLSEPNRSSFE